MSASPRLQRQARRREVPRPVLGWAAAVFSWSLCCAAAAEHRAPEEPVAVRPSKEEPMKELRRQLLEHNRHWRNRPPPDPNPEGQAGSRPLPEPLTDAGPEKAAAGQGGAALLSQPLSGRLSDPLSGSLSRTSSGAANAPAPAEGVASPLVDPDARLSERERSLLRQQLRESLRRQTWRENR